MATNKKIVWKVLPIVQEIFGIPYLFWTDRKLYEALKNEGNPYLKEFLEGDRRKLAKTFLEAQKKRNEAARDKPEVEISSSKPLEDDPSENPEGQTSTDATRANFQNSESDQGTHDDKTAGKYLSTEPEIDQPLLLIFSRHKKKMIGMILTLILIFSFFIAVKNSPAQILFWSARHNFVRITDVVVYWNTKNINFRDEEGRTPLMIAAFNNSYEVVLELLKRKTNDVNAQSDEGKTALMFASQTGFVDVVRLLLSNGASIEVKDIKGNTALIYAVSSNQIPATEELLKWGANVNASAKNLLTPLMLAAQSRVGNDRMLEILLDHKGIDLEKMELNGKTALQLTVGKYPSRLEKLLVKGADKESRDKKSRTPFLNALIFNHEPSVNLLLDYGAKISFTLEEAKEFFFQRSILGKYEISNHPCEGRSRSIRQARSWNHSTLYFCFKGKLLDDKSFSRKYS